MVRKKQSWEVMDMPHSGGQAAEVVLQDSPEGAR